MQVRGPAHAVECVNFLRFEVVTCKGYDATVEGHPLFETPCVHVLTCDGYLCAINTPHARPSLHVRAQVVSSFCASLKCQAARLPALTSPRHKQMTLHARSPVRLNDTV